MEGMMGAVGTLLLAGANQAKRRHLVQPHAHVRGKPLSSADLRRDPLLRPGIARCRTVSALTNLVIMPTILLSQALLSRRVHRYSKRTGVGTCSGAAVLTGISLSSMFTEGLQHAHHAALCFNRRHCPFMSKQY